MDELVKTRFEKLQSEYDDSQKALHDFVDNNIDCKMQPLLYAKINDVLKTHALASVSSEFFYRKDKTYNDYKSKVFKAWTFKEARQAKLHDTLLEFISDTKDIFCVIRMITNMGK